MLDKSFQGRMTHRIAARLIHAAGRGVIVLIALILLFFGCGSEDDSDRASAQPAAATTFQGTIVAVGDSLTAGYGVDESQAYPAQLEKRLLSEGYDYRVVNAGVSGETSSGTLSRIDWVIATLNPDIVILETGANDGLRGIDPEVLERNLDKLVSILKKNGIQVILAGMQMLPNLGPEYIERFARVYPAVARKQAVPLIPFFLQGVAGKSELNQEDNIHPTAEGYSRIVENVYPYVLQVLREMEK
jgi:acyl-CoA thioesterase-1